METKYYSSFEEMYAVLRGKAPIIEHELVEEEPKKTPKKKATKKKEEK